MVRIAVRTITLNVYKVDNQAMLHYIRDKTAVPYFSNLVWFIGSHVIELDNCVQTDEEHRNRGKLSDLVAEHLDHLHYLNDILIIHCEFLNDVLTDHLLNRLFLPLYVCSLENQDTGGERPKISLPVSLYLLSQVFLIIHHAPLVNSLADVILNGDLSEMYAKTEQAVQRSCAKPSIRCFIKPTESLERSLEMNKHKGKRRVQKRPNYKNVGEEEDEDKGPAEDAQEDAEKAKGTEGGSKGMKTSGEREEIEMVIMERGKLPELASGTSMQEQNTTDEEKSAATGLESVQWSRPFLDMVYHALDSADDDYHALFVLCLLYAMSHNKGMDPEKLERIQLPVPSAAEKTTYNHLLAERLIRIMNNAAQPDGKIRLAALELSCLLLKRQVVTSTGCIMKDVHLACLEGAREESVHLVRHFYKGEEIFLDMFEDEYRSMTMKPMNVEYLMMDASILLPPTGTPLTGIDFVKRLPCGDVEKTRRAIRVFFMLRSLSLQLRGEPETQLPLTREEDLIKTDDVLDLRFAVAQCINQHSSPSLSSPSPSASGSPSGSASSSHCDSGAASSSSTPSVAQSPSDDPMTMEQPQPNLPDQLVIVSETEADARPSQSPARSRDAETASLSPSLTPAQQPSISLLCEDTADTLSVESLTLVPPVDPHSLHTLLPPTGIPPPPAPAAEGTVTPGEEAAPSGPVGPTEP